MNTGMFIVGFIIFSVYIVGLFYMIRSGHEDQKNEMLNDPEIPKEFKEKYK